MNKKTKVTDYIVEPVERKVIQNFIHKHHYSHNTNGIQQMECFALFREGKFGFDKEMIGAAMYAIPSMPSTAKKYNPDNPDKCRELRRLCCLDEAPTNTESYFISQTLKMGHKLERSAAYRKSRPKVHRQSAPPSAASLGGPW